MKQDKTVIIDGKFVIKDGVLEEYRGNDEHVVVPRRGDSLGSQCF